MYRLRDYPDDALERLVQVSLWSANERNLPQGVIGFETAPMVYQLGGLLPGRIGQLEKAANLELKSVMETAAALGYDLELSLIPRAGGRTLGAVVRLGS